MLVKQETTELMSGGLGEGNDFKIAATAKAFDILSSNLYQNKILAVIREVSCNAADAHKMVNKPLSEIQITLPTWSTPVFSVRDFGPGLSHKSMLHLYTTFFLSDKDKSNYLIGGLGLGSKSPFSVADQFIVTSWYEGTKRSYICFKNNGIPAINLTSEEPSAEPSGLKVEVVVSTTRLSDWGLEAFKYFRWWPDAPQLTQCARPEFIFNDEIILQSNVFINNLPSWAFSSKLIDPVVYMGMVPYQLNFAALTQLPPEVGEALNGSGLIMVFPIGELEINPSRETLSYNPTTCQALCARLATIYKTVQSEIEAKIASATTLFEARQMAFSTTQVHGNTSLKSMLSRVTKQNKFKPTWKGQVVTDRISTDFLNFNPLPQGFSYVRNSRHHTWNRPETIDFSCSEVSHSITSHNRCTDLFVHTTNPITAKTYRTLSHYATTNFPSSSIFERGYFTFTILAHPSFTDLETHLTEKGFPPLLKLEDMPPPPKNVSPNGTPNTSFKTQCYHINNYGGSVSPTEAELDLKGGGFYTPFFNGQSKFHLLYLASIKQCLDPNQVLPFIGLAERRLKSVTLRKALLKENWIELNPQAIALIPCSTLEEKIKLHYLKEDHIYQKPTSGPSLPSAYKIFLLRLPTTTLNVPPDWLKFAAISTKVYVGRYITTYLMWEAYKEHLTDDQKKAIVAGQQAAQAIYDDMMAFFQRHPLLTAITDYSKLSVDQIFDYINR